MEQVRTIRLNRGVFDDNNLAADVLRRYLKEKGVFLINVMSSPGAGKTTTLISLINALSENFRIGVMEADIDSDVDARKIASNAKCKAIQLHTGGMCHLDAEMTKQGLDELGVDGLDVVFLENVGNLVCPAEFDTGACMDMIISSVPEGDDKPLKYPLIFGKCDLVVLNKIDAAPYFDFDFKKFENNVHMRNSAARIIGISAKSGENVRELKEYLVQTINKWRGN